MNKTPSPSLAVGAAPSLVAALAIALLVESGVSLILAATLASVLLLIAVGMAVWKRRSRRLLAVAIADEAVARLRTGTERCFFATLGEAADARGAGCARPPVLLTRPRKRSLSRRASATIGWRKAIMGLHAGRLTLRRS